MVFNQQKAKINDQEVPDQKDSDVYTKYKYQDIMVFTILKSNF